MNFVYTQPRRAFRRRPRNGRAGTYTVELAFTLPVLVLLLFGGFEFGRANLLRNIALDAAYEGAREAIVPGASAAEARATAENVLGIIGIANAKIAVVPSTITPETPSVRVTVSFPFATSTGIGELFLSNLQLRGECELTREGF